MSKPEQKTQDPPTMNWERKVDHILISVKVPFIASPRRRGRRKPSAKTNPTSTIPINHPTDTQLATLQRVTQPDLHTNNSDQPTHLNKMDQDLDAINMILDIEKDYNMFDVEGVDIFSSLEPSLQAIVTSVTSEVNNLTTGTNTLTTSNAIKEKAATLTVTTPQTSKSPLKKAPLPANSVGSLYGNSESRGVIPYNIIFLDFPARPDHGSVFSDMPKIASDVKRFKTGMAWHKPYRHPDCILCPRDRVWCDACELFHPIHDIVTLMTFLQRDIAVCLACVQELDVDDACANNRIEKALRDLPKATNVSTYTVQWLQKQEAHWKNKTGKGRMEADTTTTNSPAAKECISSPKQHPSCSAPLPPVASFMEKGKLPPLPKSTAGHTPPEPAQKPSMGSDESDTDPYEDALPGPSPREPEKKKAKIPRRTPYVMMPGRQVVLKPLRIRPLSTPKAASEPETPGEDLPPDCLLFRCEHVHSALLKFPEGYAQQKHILQAHTPYLPSPKAKSRHLADIQKKLRAVKSAEEELMKSPRRGAKIRAIPDIPLFRNKKSGIILPQECQNFVCIHMAETLAKATPRNHRPVGHSPVELEDAILVAHYPFLEEQPSMQVHRNVYRALRRLATYQSDIELLAKFNLYKDKV